MSTSSTAIDLFVDTDTEEETDTGSDLEGFVIPDADVEEMVNTTPEEDEKAIVEQYDNVKNMGFQVVEGRRRSTRARKATEYYRDPDFEKVMFSSSDDLSDLEVEEDQESGVEYCVDDYEPDDE